ncbi:hypothetical protein SEA_SPEEDDEMON_920 [Gordonia phage SpeedDemon]|uniref:Uncharacterized protein n=1 Tax=Gordonia phage Bantam TaxID=1887641 RepID=A0A1B3AYF8_9CAUD|nr:hypothetical protein BIZ77_gp088 [Gordonia phage Bantam]AOE43780.1 hypothetical protein SEA_BANTAM_91 [Gordonia phage Bantam]QNL30542.1 hypothetical protein SEA_SPEEDDEMON_920 [Gordonia phage SpeedDemon]
MAIIYDSTADDYDDNSGYDDEDWQPLSEYVEDYAPAYLDERDA